MTLLSYPLCMTSLTREDLLKETDKGTEVAAYWAKYNTGLLFYLFWSSTRQEEELHEISNF